MIKHEVTGVRKDAIIKIEVSAGFFFRISQLLLEYGAEHFPGAELKDVMEFLKEGNPRTNHEYHLITLLSLVHELETQAKEQDLIITEEVEIDLAESDSDTPETSPES